MADYTFLSHELIISCCLVDAINAKNDWLGDLTAGPEVEESATNALAVFKPASKLENEDLNNLLIHVTLNSGIIEKPGRDPNCIRKHYDLVVCLMRKFDLDDNAEIDQLFYMKNQLETLIPKIDCEGYQFVSYADQRVASIDRDQAKKQKFISFVPATYRLNDSSPTIPEPIG